MDVFFFFLCESMRNLTRPPPLLSKEMTNPDRCVSRGSVHFRLVQELGGIHPSFPQLCLPLCGIRRSVFFFRWWPRRCRSLLVVVWLVGFTIGSDLFGLESIPPGAFFGLQPFGLGDLRIAREFNGLCRFDMISVDLARSSGKT